MTRFQASCVAVGGRGLLIAGPPGSGKSTLALKLIDRAATLVGDDGVELARLAPPLTVDNMEGISARQDSAGRTLIYLMSDDNYSVLQRTLLLMFEYRG